jgi:transposase
MQKRQRLSAEFKREAVRLLKSGDRPAAVVARELGIPRNRLYKWEQHLETKGSQAFSGSGRPNATGDELATLRRENARLKEEIEILKKAEEYFARALPGGMDSGAAGISGAKSVPRTERLGERLFRLARPAARSAG